MLRLSYYARMPSSDDLIQHLVSSGETLDKMEEAFATGGLKISMVKSKQYTVLSND